MKKTSEKGIIKNTGEYKSTGMKGHITYTRFPTRLVKAEINPEKRNEFELYLNNGWQINIEMTKTNTEFGKQKKYTAKVVGIPTPIEKDIDYKIY